MVYFGLASKWYILSLSVSGIFGLASEWYILALQVSRLLIPVSEWYILALPVSDHIGIASECTTGSTQ